MPQRHHTTAGFTLIEMAIVVALFGLLVSGGLLGVGQFFDALKLRDTRDRMTQAEQALSAFVIQNGKLPCADVTFDGLEDRDGGDDCQRRPTTGVTLIDVSEEMVQGIIPYRTLGLAREQATDGWHNFFTYVVSVSLAEPDASATPVDPLDCNGQGEIDYAGVPLGEIEPLDDPANDGWPNNGTPADTNDDPPRAAYALISHGENGLGAVSQSGNQRSSTGTSANELRNVIDGGNGQRDASTDAEIGTSMEDAGTSTPFDDVVRVRTPAQTLYSIGCNNNPGAT